MKNVTVKLAEANMHELDIARVLERTSNAVDIPARKHSVKIRRMKVSAKCTIRAVFDRKEPGPAQWRAATAELCHLVWRELGRVSGAVIPLWRNNP
jgi:succinate dehydrogenase/fumarate reductase flavoprotein subunit